MFNLSLIQTTQIRRAIDCVKIQSLERSMWCGWPLILERCDAIGNPERHVHKASHRSNNRDHARNLSYYCLLALHKLWCYSSRTSRSWWITQSTQHHWRGCNSCNGSLHMQAEHDFLLCNGCASTRFENYTQQGSFMKVAIQWRWPL